MKTTRAKMSYYLQELKEDGYTSLRTRYYTNLQSSFPALDRNQSPSLPDPGQVDILDQQNNQAEEAELQEEQEEQTPQASPSAAETVDTTGNNDDLINMDDDSVPAEISPTPDLTKDTTTAPVITAY